MVRNYIIFGHIFPRCYFILHFVVFYDLAASYLSWHNVFWDQFILAQNRVWSCFAHRVFFPGYRVRNYCFLGSEYSLRIWKFLVPFIDFMVFTLHTWIRFCRASIKVFFCSRKVTVELVWIRLLQNSAFQPSRDKLLYIHH